MNYVNNGTDRQDRDARLITEFVWSSNETVLLCESLHIGSTGPICTAQTGSTGKIDMRQTGTRSDFGYI